MLMEKCFFCCHGDSKSKRGRFLYFRHFRFLIITVPLHVSAHLSVCGNWSESHLCKSKILKNKFY